MSNSGALLTFNEGMEIYKQIYDAIRKECQKVEVAGSLRRENTIAHDVELTCIPYPEKDLLGTEFYVADGIKGRLKYLRGTWAGDIVKGGDKYIKFFMASPNVNVDIFITTPNQYGVIQAIRTGSASFSKWLVTSRQHGGALPGNMKIKDGWLMQGEKKIPAPSERIFFEAIKIKYIEPNRRNFPPTKASDMYI